MKDPFEAAFEDQDSPPQSPNNEEIDDRQQPVASAHPPAASGGGGGGKVKDEEEEEEEIEFGKFSSAAAGDPDKKAKMQAILSQFTEEQMSRYESFRRSGFQKSNMKRDLKAEQVIGTGRESGGLYYFDEYPPKLLASITGSQKISMPMTIVVSGIAKMLVGELVETGRIVMAERNESGPIRPCHIREAYRRLKLEGKIPKRSVPRLFR